MARKKSAKYPHKWPDGSYHSIPYQQHRQNVDAKRYGINLDDPLSAPLSNREAYGLAEQAADRVYGPQIQTQQTLNNSLQPWFDQYVTQVGAQRQAAAAFAQPYVQNAQTAVQNAGQVAPGLDPSSAQYATEQRAAQGRQAIQQNSANVLATVPVLADNAYGAQLVNAQRELPQLKTYGAQQLGALKSQRGAAVVENYGQGRTAAQNADIAYKTLGLDTAKAAGRDPITGEKLPEEPEDRITSGAFAGYSDSEIGAMSPGERQAKIDAYAKSKGTSGDKINKYGIPESQWARWSTSHRQRVIRQYGSGSGGKSKDEEKRIAGVRKATGDFKSKITDGIGDWDLLEREPVPVPDKEDVKDGKKIKVPQKPRKATTDEVRRAMREKGYSAQEIHIVLLRRVGKPLDKAAIDYMRSKGLRIPREWMPKKGSGITTERSRPATRNDPYGSGVGHK